MPAQGNRALVAYAPREKVGHLEGRHMAHVYLFVARYALQERKLLQDLVVPLPIPYVPAERLALIKEDQPSATTLETCSLPAPEWMLGPLACGALSRVPASFRATGGRTLRPSEPRLQPSPLPDLPSLHFLFAPGEPE